VTRDQWSRHLLDSAISGRVEEFYAELERYTGEVEAAAVLVGRLAESGSDRGSQGVPPEGQAFKVAVFNDLLARFSDVRVAFVRHAGLVVPEEALPDEGEARVLSYGLGMPVPILDLSVTGAGISAVLSFSRTSCETFVPWEAVVGIRGYGELNSPAAPGGPPRSKLTLVP
jgi:hypothetical protein